MRLFSKASKLGSYASRSIASVFLAMLIFYIGTLVNAGVLGVVLPGNIARIIGSLAILGLLGSHYVRTWPIWGTNAEYRAYNEFNMRDRPEEFDPQEVAEILSLIGDASSDDGQLTGFSPRTSAKLADAVNDGVQAEKDPKRVISQLSRIEGKSTKEAESTAMQYLMTLFEATERSIIERILWKVRHAGYFLILRGSRGLNEERNPVEWSDISSLRRRVQRVMALPIAKFSAYTPADEQVMREAMNSDNEKVRKYATVAYGRRALFYPEQSGEIADVLIKLTNDTDGQLRLGATYGLEFPAIYDKTARQRLNELQDGPDPDLREVASELMAGIEEVLGTDEMNVDDVPEEHAADPDELASHAADLDAMLDEESGSETGVT